MNAAKRERRGPGARVFFCAVGMKWGKCKICAEKETANGGGGDFWRLGPVGGVGVKRRSRRDFDGRGGLNGRKGGV